MKPNGAAGKADWLAGLPAKAAAAAQAAVAGLPRDAAVAGEALPAVLAAWLLVDPEKAAELLDAWLATADADGNLQPACPVVCQWAERISEARPEAESWLSSRLPVLAKCMMREFDRYDARGTGLPVWNSAAEALCPAEYAPGRFTVDLAVLLSNEAAAFLRLAARRDDLARELGEAEGEKRELDDWLKESFWDEEASAFHRLDAGAESVPDFSPCGYFPLAWENRTAAMAEGLRSRTAELGGGTWTPRAWLLLFALLLNSAHGSVVAQMRRAGLPAGAMAPEQAAWTLLTLGADAVRATYQQHIPPSARWLDARGRLLARLLLGGGVVLLVGLLGWGFLHRENRGGEGPAELERRARLACTEGDHARAAALYARAARGGNENYFRYRQAGEWMHLEQYADAEAAYRALLARDPDTPNARFNLALAVLKQGRREEARELYRALAAEPALADVPELAGRARLAAELIDRQIALDRE